MDFDRSIFKAHDIRGMVPDQLTADLAYRIGNSLAGYLKPTSIAVGRDMRSLSEEMFEALTTGILDRGADVADLGMISTDALYFAVGKFEFDGGVMITASQYPANYCRFKICRREAVPLSGTEGFDLIADDIAENRTEKVGNRGSTARKDISRDFAEHVLSFVDPTTIKQFTIAIDAGSGMAGLILPLIFQKLPCEIIPVHFEPDGSFPDHSYGPIEPENLVDLQKAMAAGGADLGVAFDGNADRMLLLDKDGSPLGGDMVTALVADNILSQTPDETVLYNLICSRAVPELIKRRGGTAVRSSVGHANVIPLMKKHNAIFGGERSGRFYFRDNWFTHSGLIALLECLELLSRSGRSLRDILTEIDPYFRSDEISSRVASIEEKIDEAAAAFFDGEDDRLDGLTIQYSDWWFNLRPSHTEPKLLLNVEAGSRDLLDEKIKKLLEIIRS